MPDEIETFEGPDREGELVDTVLDWLQTNVLKLIVVKIIPLILGSGVVVGLLAWLQGEVGIDLDPAVVASVVVTVMGGVIATAFAYVKNHGGAAHLGGILLELTKLRELGQQTLPPGLPPGADGDATVAPVVPPGVHQ